MQNRLPPNRYRTNIEPMQPDLNTKFLQILGQHQGLARAISVAEMAVALGFERDKAGQRRAQLIKASVVEQGHLVGSSCGHSHGWYMPQTQQEIDATLGQYKARIRALAETIRKTEGAAALDRFLGSLGQLAMDFERQKI